MSSHLQSRLGIKGVKSGLLRECLSQGEFADPEQAGGGDQGAAAGAAPRAPDRRGDQQRRRGALRGARCASGMLRALPGVFVAGEMVDWEAPTGGYLLTACFASGRGGAGAADWPGLLPEGHFAGPGAADAALCPGCRIADTVTSPLPRRFDIVPRLRGGRSRCRAAQVEVGASARRCSASRSPEPVCSALNSLQLPTTSSGPSRSVRPRPCRCCRHSASISPLPCTPASTSR
jgi:hypothetical protein